MEAVYLDNRSKSVKTAALEALETSNRADIAVAYSSPEGVGALEEGLADMTERGGKARLLAGLDDFITDLRAAEHFERLQGAEFKVFLPTSVGDRARFHPKLYVFEGREESSVIVGSANLTGAGLETNYEASLWLRAEANDPLLKAVGESFQMLWDSPRAVALSRRVEEEYSAARRARREALAEVTELEEYRRWREAVRANFARVLIKPNSRKWLMITSPSNFEICLTLSRWGDERRNRIAQVQPGDGILFYITGEHTLGALAVAVGPVRVSQERPWPDRPYPYQMDIQFLSLADPRLSIRPMIEELDLFDRTRAGWGTTASNDAAPAVRTRFRDACRSRWNAGRIHRRGTVTSEELWLHLQRRLTPGSWVSNWTAAKDYIRSSSAGCAEARFRSRGQRVGALQDREPAAC